MWQEIAIYIIGIMAIGYVAHKVYRMFTASRSQGPCCGCSGCPTGDKEASALSRPDKMAG